MAASEQQAPIPPTIPSMTISTVVTDLDGTFWTTSMTLHPETVAAVAALDAAETQLVIATGRRAQSTLAGLDPLGLGDRPSILMNGALVRKRVDGPSLHVDPIPTDKALHTMQLFRTVGLEPLVYVDHPDLDMFSAPGASAAEGFIAEAPGVRHVDDLASEIPRADVIGFGAFGFPKAMLAALAEEIERSDSASAIVSPSHIEGDHGIMVQGSGVDKATGLAVMERNGILDLATTAAVGDGHNDIGMLRAAAIAIVPENASPEIRDLADVLIPPNEEGGWKQIPSIVGL